MRNFRSTSNLVSWSISPAAGNPPGFAVFPSAGTNMVPPITNATTLAPFAVMIAPAVPPGTAASFNITFTDMSNGLPFPNDFEQFTVVAATNVEVTPLTPSAPPASVPVMLTWVITNETSTTITQHYSFKEVFDQASQEQFNNGGSYYIVNNTALDKTATSGSVVIGPNSSASVSTPVVSVKFCGREMCGGYCMVVDGAEAVVVMNNEMDDTLNGVMPIDQLLGTSQGGVVGVIINDSGQMYTAQTTTFLGEPLPQVIDSLGLAIQQNFLTVSNFNFQPLVDPDTLGVMVPQGVAVGFNSSDPGLTWAPYNYPTPSPYIGWGTVQVLPNGSVTFVVGTQSNNLYLVRASADLTNPTNWVTVGTINAKGPASPFTNNPGTGPLARFYRVELLQ
jgi:hypothetical protein